MAEKIKSNKKEKEIKEDLVDINIKSLKLDSNGNDSRLITRVFNGVEDANLFKNKVIPFIYNELLDNNTNNKFNSYYSEIKQELRYAYGTMESLQ
jgi:hypothetical protein